MAKILNPTPFGGAGFKVEFDFGQATRDVNDGETFELSSSDLREIGERMIEIMVSNAESSKGASFGNSSKFKFPTLASSTQETYAGGVRITKGRSKGRTISKFGSASDLTLSGDMLDSIDVVSTGTNRLTIGIRSGFQGEKAGWHNFGTPKMPARTFMNISNGDYSSQIKSIVRGAAPPKEKTVTESQANRLIKGLFADAFKGFTS